ncbi:hypothetical protein L13192_02695 [Pyrenophora tritici-repentis]|nr:hypothetical protein L13192_02695 [Pyrenophora tritici-repentis]
MGFVLAVYASPEPAETPEPQNVQTRCDVDGGEAAPHGYCERYDGNGEKLGGQACRKVGL